MSSATPRTGGYSSNPHVANNESSKGKTIGFAIVIILGLGGLAVVGVGLGGFGAQQGWWQVGSLSNLSQVHSIIMMAAGGGGGIVFLIMGIVGSVKNHQANSCQQNDGKESTEHGSTVDSKNTKVNSEPTKKAGIVSSTVTKDSVIDGFSIFDEVNSTQKAPEPKKNLSQIRDKTILTKDSPLVMQQEFPQDAKKALDEIFITPLPARTSAIQVLYNHAHPDGFITNGDSIIFPLKKADYLVKMQGQEEIFYCQHNLQRVVMNRKIQDCILKYNLQHITTIKKYIYVLPHTNTQELNDTNAVVIAQKIQPIAIEFNDELSDEQYEELLTVVKTIKYADLRPPNLTWVYEHGKKKIAILDTEDIASKFVDTNMKYYLNSFYHSWRSDKDLNSIIEIANELLNTDPETSKIILKLFLSYYRGVLRLKPKDDQVDRKKVFAKAVAEIENELQEIINDVKPSFKVKLS